MIRKYIRFFKNLDTTEFIYFLSELVFLHRKENFSNIFELLFYDRKKIVNSESGYNNQPNRLITN